MKQFWRGFLILFAVTVLAVALLSRRVCEVPEVRLHRLLRMEAQPRGFLDEQYDSHFSGIAGFEAETWRAEFEIRIPPGSEVVLTNGQIRVETLGLDGAWTATASPTTLLLSLPVSGVLSLPSGMLPSGMRRTSGNIRFSLPGQTRSCRFTIGFRRPTPQERCRRVLDKWGLRRRFPAVSTWISDRMPSTERWLECHRDVQLPPFPNLEQEAHSTYNNR